MSDILGGAICSVCGERFFTLDNLHAHLLTHGAATVISDTQRESLIDAAYDQFVAATSESARTQYWRDMCYHVRLRSPEQILKMETERRISAAFAPLFTYDMEKVG